MPIDCPNAYYDKYMWETMCKVQGKPCHVVCKECTLDCERAGKRKQNAD